MTTATPDGRRAGRPGEPGYTGRDLTEDAIAVLDGLGISRAHIAGMSAGGGIAQELGLAHRDRIRSLTLLSTTFARDSPEGLPGPTLAGEPAEPDWDDRVAVLNHMIAGERLFAGPGAFDETRTRAIASARSVAAATSARRSATTGSSARVSPRRGGSPTSSGSRRSSSTALRIRSSPSSTAVPSQRHSTRACWSSRASVISCRRPSTGTTSSTPS